MINSNRKTKNRGLFSGPKFFVVMSIVLIIAISIPLGKSLSKQRSADKEIAEVQKEIANIENKNQDLTKLVSYLGTDDFIEEQARLNLNLKKQGENVVVIKDLASSTQTEDVNAAKTQQKNMTKWKNYFFK
jgi:cell division protein FtsB